MTTQLAERQIVAFLDGEDSLEIANIIHSTAGAAQFGYAGPLVGGVTVYGWAAPALVEALGESLARSRLVGLPPAPAGISRATRSRRGCRATTRAATSSQWPSRRARSASPGTVGHGDAAWLGEIAMPQRREPVPPSDPTTLMTPADTAARRGHAADGRADLRRGGRRLRRRVRA